ncbi:hypothetical protein CEXT_233431 [Caerostris extrusa]|uniref:Uncharacterized protein n=1 Tax=Caerostris extrusa TaxID=172846 RepID=A0AAV4X3F2_CAEEX|nr:hypothetical protein CEXT_233431 [Caerostris extrusa]
MCDPKGNDHMLEMWKNQFYQQYMQINKMVQWQHQTFNNASYPWKNFANISYPHQNLADSRNPQQNSAYNPYPQQHWVYNPYPQQHWVYNPYPQQHWVYNPYPQQNFENSQCTDNCARHQNLQQDRGYKSPRKLHSAYINQANYNNTVYDNYSNVANCSEDNITDDDDSECELVFNFDCIMAMRAEKGKKLILKIKKEEEKEKDDDDDSESIASIEFIDAIVDKNFEFVALNSAQQLETFRGKPRKPNAQGDMDEEMEIRTHLYGDKAKVIAELETSMTAIFDQLCDHHQPIMFTPTM